MVDYAARTSYLDTFNGPQEWRRASPPLITGSSTVASLTALASQKPIYILLSSIIRISKLTMLCMYEIQHISVKAEKVK